MENLNFLVSENIYLQIIDEEDLNSIYKWKNNLELSNLIMAKPFTYTNEDVRRWFTNNYNDKNQILLWIYKKEENNIIWFIRLMFIDYINSNCELWIMIWNDKYKWKWYWKEAIELIIKYAFNNLHLSKIYLKVLSINLNAIKLYKKLWFIEEWILKKHFWYIDKYVDVLYFAKFNN